MRHGLVGIRTMSQLDKLLVLLKYMYRYYVGGFTNAFYATAFMLPHLGSSVMCISV